MIVKLLAEHLLMFLSLKRDCRGSSESTQLKMSNRWKSHALAQIKLDSRDAVVNEYIGYCPCTATFVIGYCPCTATFVIYLE